MLDVAEATFPFQGQVRFEDAETAERLDVDPQAIQAAYLKALHDFIEQTRKEELGKVAGELSKLGVDWSDAPEGGEGTGINPIAAASAAVDTEDAGA